MTSQFEKHAGNISKQFARIAPGLPALLNYERANLRHDIVAGVSVAAESLIVSDCMR